MPAQCDANGNDATEPLPLQMPGEGNAAFLPLPLEMPAEGAANDPAPAPAEGSSAADEPGLRQTPPASHCSAAAADLNRPRPAAQTVPDLATLLGRVRAQTAPRLHTVPETRFRRHGSPRAARRPSDALSRSDTPSSVAAASDARHTLFRVAHPAPPRCGSSKYPERRPRRAATADPSPRAKRVELSLARDPRLLRPRRPLEEVSAPEEEEEEDEEEEDEEEDEGEEARDTHVVCFGM